MRMVIDRILREFGLDPKKGHIVNGHVPVKRKRRGEPGQMRRESSGHRRRVLPGISEGNGIAGYTLIYNSYGLRLVAHEPFEIH